MMILKYILVLIFVFGLMSLMAPISYAENYSSYQTQNYSVISKDGLNMGNVAVSRKDNLLYMDYDFNEPNDCKLTQLNTHIKNQNRIYITDTKSESGRSLQYDGTYITPRDAVIAFDIANIPVNEKSLISSRLEFDCNSGGRTAWISSDGKVVDDSHFFKYETNQRASAWTRTMPRVFGFFDSPVDDGYDLVYNQDEGWWEWRGPLDKPSTSPSVNYSPAVHDDGYRRVFNQDEGWWEWVYRPSQ